MFLNKVREYPMWIPGGKSIPGTGNSQCKGSKMRVALACSRMSHGASEAAAEGARGSWKMSSENRGSQITLGLVVLFCFVEFVPVMFKRFFLFFLFF